MDYKPIRNKLRSFTFESITIEILILLKEIEKSKKIRFAFWHLLLLLKWNLEFSDKKYQSKNANRNDIIKLLKLVEELEMSHGVFNPNYGDFALNKAMTILAHQQFLYQNNVYWDTFVRQLILFDELKHKHCIKNAFEKIAKISIEKFLKISFIVYLVCFINESSEKGKPKFIYKGYITKDISDLLIQLHGRETYYNYFNLLSISKESIKDFIESDKRAIRNYNLQPFEASIFTRKPFFVYNGKYTIPYKDILKHNFNHFIYEFMKNNDEGFTTELGIRLEKYIKKGLDEIQLKYKTEKQLKTILGEKENLVDFIVNNRILVEVKAIELKPYTSINPNDKILANEFRKNIVKGYAKQMINVAKKLNPNEIYYGMIITYKKLFLGNSSDIWQQFLKDESMNICSLDDLKIVPYENLFFIDIESWDKLVQILKDNKIELTDLLDKIKEADLNPKTKKFNFSMHLEDIFNFQKFDLSYLEQSYTRMNI
ncbi:hypothetical protein WJN01_11140 [Flavobacteriaceae bacterium SZ-1-7]|uniref:hypothetical protein n=1 Tax=Tamlana sedimenti TaxID=3134126 RepID=UPI003121260F